MSESTLETDIIQEIHERTIKNFMDVLILTELRKKGSMSGHDFTVFVHQKFHIMMSSGTIYSVLYSLERDELIKGSQTSTKRVYKLTDKGEKTIKALLEACELIQSFMATLF